MKLSENIASRNEINSFVETGVVDGISQQADSVLLTRPLKSLRGLVVYIGNGMRCHTLALWRLSMLLKSVFLDQLGGAVSNGRTIDVAVGGGGERKTKYQWKDWLF